MSFQFKVPQGLVVSVLNGHILFRCMLRCGQVNHQVFDNEKIARLG